MRLGRVVTAASGRVARSTAAQGFASRQSEVASPAGLEPATCGLEIRCCYPAELRGRDLKAFTEERLCLPAAGRHSFPRPELRQAMLDIFSSRSFRPM